MGKPHQEIEIKLTCEPAVLAEIMTDLQQASAFSPAIKQLHTVYYDTNTLSLRRNGASLRLRAAEGEVPLLGFKARSEGRSTRFHRYEVEVANPGDPVDLSLFDDVTLKIFSGLAGKRQLLRQFEVNVKRQLLRAVRNQADIEIAADQGAVHGVRGTSEISELELELKAGPELELYEFAAELVRKFPLALSFISKSDRGYHLSGKAGAILAAQSQPEFTAIMSLDDMIEATLSHALYRFTFHWHDLRATDNPEATHQMRIALRQLRTALSMFSKVRPCEAFGVIKHGARKLVGILGEARNFDVLAESLAENSKDPKFTAKSVRALRAIVNEKRALCRQAARDAINGREASLFVLDAQSLIVTRAWRKNADGSSSGDGKTMQSIRQILDQLYARVLKKGRGFQHLSDIELHDLRLAIKALSFACTTFSDVLRQDESAQSFVATLGNLQKKLGIFNDNVFELQFCEEVAASPN